KIYYYTVRALNGDRISPSFDASKSITYKKPSTQVPQTTFSKTSGNVTFKVQYPENITCGAPTTFKLSSEGTTDKVQYALYSLTTEDGTIVYDTSYGSNGKFFRKIALISHFMLLEHTIFVLQSWIQECLRMCGLTQVYMA
ncbi:hypothetical protein ROSEINA2194_03869, partial [Roseburia inulinivorans DSM 16841]